MFRWALSGLRLCVAFLISASFLATLWCEVGPYQWVAAAQLALFDSYMQSLTFLGAFFVWIALIAVPVLALVRWRVTDSNRLLWAGFAAPWVLPIPIAVLLVFYPPQAEPAQRVAALLESAPILPHLVEELPPDWTLAPDFQRATGFGEVGQRWTTKVYVPLIQGTEVRGCIKLSELQLLDWDEDGPGDEIKSGVIALEPLPYLVRREFEKNGLKVPYWTGVLRVGRGMVDALIVPLCLGFVVALILVREGIAALRRRLSVGAVTG